MLSTSVPKKTEKVERLWISNWNKFDDAMELYVFAWVSESYQFHFNLDASLIDLQECTVRFFHLEKSREVLDPIVVHSVVRRLRIPSAWFLRHVLHEFGRKFWVEPCRASAPVAGCDNCLYESSLTRKPPSLLLSVSSHSKESSTNRHWNKRLWKNYLLTTQKKLNSLSHLIRLTWISSDEIVFHAPDKYSRQILVATSLISLWDLVACQRWIKKTGISNYLGNELKISLWHATSKTNN